MPRKAPPARKIEGEDDEPASKPASAAHLRLRGPDDLAALSLKACLIARDAAFNVRDLLTHSSRMAFLAIKDCEKELDVIERHIDERLPAAITRVNEARARQLLSSLKSTTDLERIGDLVMSVAMRVQNRTAKIPASDVRQLVEMSSVLRDMLDLIHNGFSTLDLECARNVLQMDKDIDRICHSLFQKHLAETVPQGRHIGIRNLVDGASPGASRGPHHQSCRGSLQPDRRPQPAARPQKESGELRTGPRCLRTSSQIHRSLTLEETFAQHIAHRVSSITQN